jgi:hypothetical protein
MGWWISTLRRVIARTTLVLVGLVATSCSDSTASQSRQEVGQRSGPSNFSESTVTRTSTGQAGGGQPASSGGSTPQGLTPEDVARVGVAPPQVPPSPKERGPSGLRLILGDKVANLPEPAISLTELLSGGPPPDGIPSIDKPVFERADAVHFVADTEPVLALTIDGEARAYPVQIAIWHEIINDTVGGVPVAVTYCPLCNSAIAYDRRVAGRVVTFGTTGMLWNSAMVMYDRQTETVWSHFNGQAIAGALTGTTLRALPMSTVSFKTWRDANPTGLVLNRTTGHNRDYGRNPYRGYDQADNTPFLFKGRIDSRFKPMTRMIGITSGEPDGPSAAIPLAAMQVDQVRHFVLGEAPVVAFWVPGTNSSLDTEAIESGTDVGATGVFRAAIGGRNLIFEAAGDRFIDVQTQSTWNLLGRRSRDRWSASNWNPSSTSTRSGLLGRRFVRDRRSSSGD